MDFVFFMMDFWDALTNGRAFFRINPENWDNFPQWVRSLFLCMNIRPNYKPITREMEIIWDLWACKHNRK